MATGKLGRPLGFDVAALQDLMGRQRLREERGGLPRQLAHRDAALVAVEGPDEGLVVHLRHLEQADLVGNGPAPELVGRGERLLAG